MRPKGIHILLLCLATAPLALLSGCDDAKVASRNLSKAADNFEVSRRIVFLNGITDTYLLVIEGLCAVVDQQNQLEVTCKTGDGTYIKHYLGLSDNVTYFAEQTQGVDVSAYHYRVVFKPQTLIPDVEFRGDASELGTAVTPQAGRG